MISRFKDKVIMLTGAAACNPQKQMGFAGETVWRFFKEGGSAAIITDVQDNEGEESVISLTKDGFESFYSHLDVTQEKEWEDVTVKALQKYGKIDYLVNIAGILDPKSISEIDTEDWKKVIDISLTGVFLGTKIISKIMSQNGGGSIVNISSMGALNGSATYGSAYGASRSALLNFTKSTALHYGSKGIRANAILPGWTRTPFTEYLYKDKTQREYRSNRVPLGRWGVPSDIASSILFMLSEDASYITGSSLLVDGGVMAGELSRPANPLQDAD